MRKTSFFLFCLSFIVLSGCGGDDIDIPDKDLEGTIDGKIWAYGSANAYRLTADGQYRARFLSDDEAVTDPCTLPSPGLTNVKAIFRPFIGSFTVSPQAIDNNQVQVAFQISPSESLIATNGFMEIFDINNTVVIGYLQAELDENNTVEGSFRMRICN